MTTEALDYVEKQADKNMEFHLNNMECLNKESHTTLAFLFLAISAAFGGSIKLISTNAGFGFGVALFIICIYLCGMAVYLALKCLKAEDCMPPSNEPKNLLLHVDAYTLEEIRKAELENLQKRIDFNQARNARTGECLNRVRLNICATPGVFLLVITLLAIISRAWDFPLF